MSANSTEKIHEFVQLFNRAEFFKSHELLENLWRETKGKERVFLQGLIQAAVALHHDKNKNEKGALEEFRLAKEKLKQFPPLFLGINAKKFLEDLKRYFLISKKERKDQPLPMIRLSFLYRE